MLRVQKVAVVPVDVEALSNATNGREKMLTQMISDRVVVTMKPADPIPVSDAGAASSQAGFNVRELESLGAPSHIQVRDEAAFHIQLDRERMLALLDAAGRSDIALPNNLDNSVIAVHIPKSVHMDYGACAGGKGAGSCVQFMQMPSPVVSVPPALNVSALAEAMLQVSGMSAGEAHSFAQSVDWSSTLVVPIPMNSTSSRAVSVDGVTGTLVQSAARGRHPNTYALVWVKNQHIYVLHGAGDPGQALAAAETIN
jgi:CBS domain-containing protein